MPHVHRIVHRLRKTARDGLCNPEQAIQKCGTEKRVMNEIVPHPVDIRVDHQRINESENEHHPERSVRVEEVKCQEICETKKPRRGRKSVPACVREKL